MTSSTLLRHAALAAAFSLAATVHAQSGPVDDPGFTDAITEQLRTALPDEHVVVIGPQRLTIGNVGFTVNLARLAQTCHANASQCDAESAHFVAGVTQA